MQAGGGGEGGTEGGEGELRGGGGTEGGEGGTEATQREKCDDSLMTAVTLQNTKPKRSERPVCGSKMVLSKCSGSAHRKRPRSTLFLCFISPIIMRCI